MYASLQSRVESYKKNAKLALTTYAKWVSMQIRSVQISLILITCYIGNVIYPVFSDL